LIVEPLYFYYRDGCHLCEEMAALFYRDWAGWADRVAWRNVDERTEWRTHYGDRVPVLADAHGVICEGRPDPDRIARYFSDLPLPL
jgi:hypothetical protein